MKKHIVVIGAGLGGLAAGIRALAEGNSVTILEKNNLPGGKMSEFRSQGFRFDTGPSLLTMPFVLDSLFALAGKSRSEYIDIVSVSPICRYFFNNGTTLDALHDVEAMCQEIERIAPGNAQQYKKFLRTSEELYNLTAEIFLFTPFQEIRKILRKKHIGKLFQLHKLQAHRTMHGVNSTLFKSPELTQLFDRFATYNGSDPYQAPATLNIIPHVEHGLGAFYIRGGMFRLAEALSTIFVNMGGTIRYNTQAKAIRVDNNTAKAVIIEGEKISADAILCNMDVAVAQRMLLMPPFSEKQRTDALEPSLSGMAFLWGVEGEEPSLAHHNIFFSGDYKSEFEHIFQKRMAAPAPTVYAAITSKTDENDAPPNCENWFVLLNMPYVSDGQDWKLMQEYSREAIFRALQRRGIQLQDRIVTEKVLTPLHFEDTYFSNKGSIYGFSSNSMFSAFLRPPNRSRKIKNLYYCGGSSHPGGGIPLVLLSGMMAAELAIEDIAGKLNLPPTHERLSV